MKSAWVQQNYDRRCLPVQARSKGSQGVQLRALGVEDAGGACAAWLAAAAAEARPAVAQLLRSCASPEALAQLDAALRGAIAGWQRGAAAARHAPNGALYISSINASCGTVLAA